MCYACKTSSCKNVIGVLPYLPYCSHSKFKINNFTLNALLFWKISMKKNIIVSTFLFTAKMRRRGNISLKLVAQMLTKAGFNHIITVDMHSKESQGFFDCAIDNLRASPFLIQYIQESVSNNSYLKIKFCHYILLLKNMLWLLFLAKNIFIAS